MIKLILILTVMFSIGCEDRLQDRLAGLEAHTSILARQNCALRNQINEIRYDSCVDRWKASEEVKQDNHEKKVRKEIERLRKLVSPDVKSDIMVLPINNQGYMVYSGSQCFRMSPENCGD